ncbi:molybdopterin-dependent oxidoreductase [Sphingorhabdus sp. Alg239-R122]|uniref:molybdopterin-dependent oxidoreductase n=1 Tax=Sphingorhabdus sp. Alg239-R122 TaxID=2305989 RepID=UPI0013D9E74C|nr:molybdopterin-dependent oxidoreductase [Sphingorhabdus sp. Alg239-R122]
MARHLTRRTLLTSSALLAGGMLSGCGREFHKSETVRKILGSAENANFAVQRALGDRMQLAREYDEADISPDFQGNGTTNPATAEYDAMAANGFADWRLELTGLFTRPQAFSMAQLRAMPQRTQITRHDCVEGWSAIGKWTGVPLKLLLDKAGLEKSANYLVFHCADRLSGVRYYESIDLIDAYHPQTIMAHRLNDAEVPVKNGAPLRLRVERQLGYKHAKYVQQIEAVESLGNMYGGKGGYWEDVGNYAWYAGI